jgi:hypothetical protein
MAQAELALMRIDAIGGAQDIAGARQLWKDCFDDVTKSAVMDHAKAKEADASTPAMSFCKDNGGTQLAWNECQARARAVEATVALLQGKRIASSLDDEGKRHFVAAAKAYDAYARAMGDYVYEVNRDGSIRGALALGLERDLLARRTVEIAKLGKFAPARTTQEQLDAAEKRMSDALERALSRATTPAVKEKVTLGQGAWLAYRDAETDLYSVVRGDKAKDQVKAPLLVRLDGLRVHDLDR